MAAPSVFSSRLALLAVLASTMGGCNQGPRLVQVSGLVTLDGVPLADAAIALHPTEEGPLAAANSDAQGRFVLATGDRQGVIPGKYRATVFKTEISDVDLSKPGDYTNLREQWITPQRYSKPETSGLEFDITGATAEMSIELESRP